MDPAAVLDLLDGLATGVGVERPVGRVLVVGCEPAVLTEGIGLSPAVAAAVDPAATAVIQLVTVVLSEEGATR
jgi:hydrogenase maturation protease